MYIVVFRRVDPIYCFFFVAANLCAFFRFHFFSAYWIPSIVLLDVLYSKRWVSIHVHVCLHWFRIYIFLRPHVQSMVSCSCRAEKQVMIANNNATTTYIQFIAIYPNLTEYDWNLSLYSRTYGWRIYTYIFLFLRKNSAKTSDLLFFAAMPRYSYFSIS